MGERYGRRLTLVMCVGGPRTYGRPGSGTYRSHQRRGRDRSAGTGTQHSAGMSGVGRARTGQGTGVQGGGGSEAEASRGDRPLRPAAVSDEVVDEALGSGPAVRHQALLRLSPAPRNVSHARRFVVQQVAAPEQDTRDLLALLTSELVTNVVVHARTELEVGVTVTDEAVLVTVHDLDLGRREAPGQDRDGGRGLLLVRALASRSGQTRHGSGGKTSWFLVHRAAAAAAADEPGVREACG